MSRIRRHASALAFATVVLGAMASPEALALDFPAFLGISTSSGVSVEARDLPGEWKDEDWRRPRWRIARGPRAGEFLATLVRKDGSEQAFRGVLVHAKGRKDVLDLVPANVPPDQSASHILFKLDMTRVDGLLLGTPRRVRKEFDGHVAKSYNVLKLIPLEPARLREILEADPKALPGGIAEGSGKDPLLVANPAQVAGFLEKYGEDSTIWASPKEGSTVVRRRPDDD